MRTPVIGLMGIVDRLPIKLNIAVTDNEDGQIVTNTQQN